MVHHLRIFYNPNGRNKGLNMKTLLIDLDGVLNEYTGNFNEKNISKIKAGEKEFLEKISKKYEVKIFTARNRLLTAK